jgi:hypothetical protein
VAVTGWAVTLPQKGFAAELGFCVWACAVVPGNNPSAARVNKRMTAQQPGAVRQDTEWHSLHTSTIFSDDALDDGIHGLWKISRTNPAIYRCGTRAPLANVRVVSQIVIPSEIESNNFHFRRFKACYGDLCNQL